MIGSVPAAPLDRGQAAPAVRRPRPWSEVPRAQLAAVARLGGLMTDIDDTLTRDGAIEPAALHALGQLRAAGVPVVAITGRPHGWCEPLAATWPVAAIVAENGAVALIPTAAGVRTEFAQDEATRRRNAQRLAAASARIVAAVPGATPARDSPGRLTDIAIDHAEHAALDDAAIARVVALMRAEGLTATVSSIHVNGWFGSHDKWSGACWMARRLFGRELAAEAAHWVYVGDSTNDQVLFDRFALAVGVANLMHFANRLEVWPAYLTEGERGQGFAEVAAALLAAHAGPARPDGIAGPARPAQPAGPAGAAAPGAT
ncbi:MAG: HAD-IIB family hydrolase [Rubrivivax sp.]|jgi:HAD superfamily hydrolase (TIGR01484 family)|nr:HAD-IIB family hydrolase [Rubrivivax sp.]MCA3257720.1 HAD-IIB family hydrolase [Rubrivivax sp.]